MKLKGKLKYILTLAILWALPLVWIVIAYLKTVPVPCRPNEVAWWSCFWIGYFGPPLAFAPIGIGVIIVTVWLIRKIIKKQ
jgi:hypothetical protein